MVEILKWYNLRESPNMPVYARSPLYWIVTFLMILSGGILALIYGINDGEILLAVNTGITAPLIIKALADTKVNVGRNNLEIPNRGAEDGPPTPGLGYDPRETMKNSTISITNFLSWR